MNTLFALIVSIAVAGSMASAQQAPISLRTDFRCGTPAAPINLIAGHVNTVRFTFTASDINVNGDDDAAMIDSNDRVYNRVPLTLRQVEAVMPAHMLQARVELRTGTIAHPLTGIPTTQYVEMDIVPGQPTGSGHDLLVGRCWWAMRVWFRRPSRRRVRKSCNCVSSRSVSVVGGGRRAGGVRAQPALMHLRRTTMRSKM